MWNGRGKLNHARLLQWTTAESDGFRIAMESGSDTRHLSDFGDKVREQQSEWRKKSSSSKRENLFDSWRTSGERNDLISIFFLDGLAAPSLVRHFNYLHLLNR